MKRYFSIRRQTCIRLLFCSLLLLFAAHAFCFFNLTYSSPSVMLNAAKGNIAQASGGAFLQPFYWRIRGGVASPLFIGLLCAVYITLSALLTADLLHLSHPWAVFALCGAMIANSAVTSVLASQLHTADALFLSQLLGTAGVFLCMRTRFGFLPGAALVAASLGMHSGGLSCAVALCLIAVVIDLLRGEDGKACLLRTGKTAIALAAGAILYTCGYFVLLRLRGYEAEALLHLPAGGSLLAVWIAPLRTMLAPLTAYTRVSVLLRALLAALCAAALFLLLRGQRPLRLAALLASALLLPLAVNLPVFAREPAGQFPLSYVYLDIFAAALLGAATERGPHNQLWKRTAAGAFSVLFLSATVFSNQVYLKKNLEMQSTLSVMTRVIDRVEQTDGYRPGYTPVAVIGTLQDSALSVPHQGFEPLAALDAASKNYAISSYEDAIWYTYEILGYPLNFVSIYEQERLSSLEEVKAMPAFPSDGCISYIGDMLVVKLSD